MASIEGRAVQSQLDAAELNDWYESLDSVAARYDSGCIAELLHLLRTRAGSYGTSIPIVTATPYLNTIPAHVQPEYPGDLQIEKRIRNLIRWNAMRHRIDRLSYLNATLRRMRLRILNVLGRRSGLAWLNAHTAGGLRKC